MLHVIPSYHSKYSKHSHFIPANTKEIYLVSKKYCIAHDDDKMCFLLNWRYHIILLGDIKDLLQKLCAFCFNYQLVDCLYTVFKNRFSAKFVVNSGQLFDNEQRAVHFNNQNRGMDRVPIIAIKRLMRRKYKKKF